MTRDEIRALVEIGTQDAADKIADELLPKPWRIRWANRWEDFYFWCYEQTPWIVAILLVGCFSWFVVWAVQTQARIDKKSHEVLMKCVSRHDASACIACAAENEVCRDVLKTLVPKSEAAK